MRARADRNAEFLGIDCSWLASDQAGHLGAFFTAGIGPIPQLALEGGPIPIEDMELRLCELPRICSAKLLVTVPRPDSYTDFAERGLFVYDWTDIHATTRSATNAYQAVAVPETLLHTNSLPANLAAAATRLRLPDLLFPTSRSIHTAQVLKTL